MSRAVRDATSADHGTITAIYAHHVRTGQASFETGPADEAGMRARHEALGCRQLVAVSGDSANAASIGLHSALGFREAGVLRSVGFKHGRWVDSLRMQRGIGPGDTRLPQE